MKWLVYCTDCKRTLEESTEKVNLAEALALNHYQLTQHKVIVGYSIKPSRKVNIT